MNEFPTSPADKPSHDEKKELVVDKPKAILPGKVRVALPEKSNEESSED